MLDILNYNENERKRINKRFEIIEEHKKDCFAFKNDIGCVVCQRYRSFLDNLREFLWKY